MELSRRGMLGGLGAVCAVGVVGFVGASSVDDPLPDGEEPDGDEIEDDTRYVDADPDARFEARLVGEDGDHALFDASGLVHVQGVQSESDEHIVAIELEEATVDEVRTTLEERGAEDDPSSFEITMTLDGVEVRRIELDGATVDALIDESWNGVVTLPFEDPDVADEVYESLAVE